MSSLCREPCLNDSWLETVRSGKFLQFRKGFDCSPDSRRCREALEIAASVGRPRFAQLLIEQRSDLFSLRVDRDFIQAMKRGDETDSLQVLEKIGLIAFLAGLYLVSLQERTLLQKRAADRSGRSAYGEMSPSALMGEMLRCMREKTGESAMIKTNDQK